MGGQQERSQSRLGIVSVATVAVGQAIYFGLLAANTDWSTDSCDGPAGNSSIGTLLRDGPYVLFGVGILVISFYGFRSRESATRIGTAVVCATATAAAVGFLLNVVYYVASGCAKG